MAQPAGFGMAQAAIGSAGKPVTFTVDAERVLDTRVNLGLAGGFASSPVEPSIEGGTDSWLIPTRRRR